MRQLLTLVSAGQSLTASLRSPGGPVTTLSTRPEPGAWRTGPAPRSRSITATCMLKAMEQGKKRIVYFIFFASKVLFLFYSRSFASFVISMDSRLLNSLDNVSYPIN